jgi:hypothetical protein
LRLPDLTTSRARLRQSLSNSIARQGAIRAKLLISLFEPRVQGARGRTRLALLNSISREPNPCLRKARHATQIAKDIISLLFEMLFDAAEVQRACEKCI